MKLAWQSWLYGLVSGFIGGGASAVVSAFVLPNLDPKDFNFGSGLHRMLVAMGSFFLAHGLLVAAAFLAKSPLPQPEPPRQVWTDEQRAAAKTNGVSST